MLDSRFGAIADPTQHWECELPGDAFIRSMFSLATAS